MVLPYPLKNSKQLQNKGIQPPEVWIQGEVLLWIQYFSPKHGKILKHILGTLYNYTMIKKCFPHNVKHSPTARLRQLWQHFHLHDPQMETKCNMRRLEKKPNKRPNKTKQRFWSIRAPHMFLVFRSRLYEHNCFLLFLHRNCRSVAKEKTNMKENNMSLH